MGGYDGPYTLGARCLSEFLSTLLVIYLGESVLANELLAKTKGHGMGFGAVSYGFGWSFFVAIVCFGQISAHLNPAFCLALWLLGDLGAADFFALSAAEVAGAAAGALLLYVHFLPHFKTIPEPPARDADEALLRSRDAVSREGLYLVSYDTRKAGAASMRGWRDNLDDIRYYLGRRRALREPAHLTLVEKALGHGSLDVEGHLRRHSVQVCDLHERLKHLDMHDLHWSASSNGRGAAAWALEGVEQGAENGSGARMRSARGLRRSRSDIESVAEGRAAPAPPATEAPPDPPARKLSPEEARKARLDALYAAVVVADQNAKLSIFATRPGIPSVFFNWIVEFLGTVVLVAGALLIEARGEELKGDLKILYGPVSAFLIGQLIVVIILGLGGPTGVAINPARDFGPRLVHWLLPIAGKGSSEWGYAWVPVTANFVGGVAGGALFLGVNQITLHALDAHP